LLKTGIEKGTTIEDKIKAIAIGGFDGLHLGHMVLIDNLGENGGVVVIKKDNFDLTPEHYRETILNIPFYYINLCDIMALTPSEFIDMLCQKFRNLEKIVGR